MHNQSLVKLFNDLFHKDMVTLEIEKTAFMALLIKTSHFKKDYFFKNDIVYQDIAEQDSDENIHPQIPVASEEEMIANDLPKEVIEKDDSFSFRIASDLLILEKYGEKLLRACSLYRSIKIFKILLHNNMKPNAEDSIFYLFIIDSDINLINAFEQLEISFGYYFQHSVFYHLNKPVVWILTNCDYINISLTYCLSYYNFEILLYFLDEKHEKCVYDYVEALTLSFDFNPHISEMIFQHHLRYMNKKILIFFL